MYDVCGPESKEGVLTENKIGVLFPKGKTTDICCISEAVGFPGGSGIKNLCASREGNGTHSSTLAWKIPWTEDPGGLQSMGSQRVRHD